MNFDKRTLIPATVMITALSLGLFDSCKQGMQDPSGEIVSRYRTVFTEPPSRIPANISVDAPIMGNGETGVAISGKPDKQVYYLARNDFWRLRSSYNESFPAVLGKIEIDIPGLEGASYLVEQDLYRAKSYSRFSKGSQTVVFRSFVAASEDMMIIEISLKGAGELQGHASLLLPAKDELDKDFSFPTLASSGTTPEGAAYILRGFKEDVDVPSKAACALKILNEKGDEFTVSQNRPVNVAVAFSSNFKSDDCLNAATRKVASMTARELAGIEDKHDLWWKNYWSQSFVETGDSLIDSFYYLSNYTLASFSRNRDFPGLFGTCVTREIPAWSGDYHLNYNFVAPFYGLFSSNHIEQAVPCNIALLAQQKRGEYYSEKLYGIKGGVLLPVGVGPLGIETTRRNHFLEKSNPEWITSGNIEDGGCSSDKRAMQPTAL